MLRLDNIHAGYGPSEVLKGISLSLNTGETAPLPAAPGEGRPPPPPTTAGVARRRGGGFFWKTQNPTKPPPAPSPARAFPLAPKAPRIFPRLTVRENLLIGAYLMATKDNR